MSAGLIARSVALRSSGVGVGRVVDVLADGARLELDAGGAQEALLAVALERRLDLAGMARDHVREAHGVLHRHAGALREVLQHRVRGIAQERDAAVDPALDRVAVAEHPELPVLAVADDLLGPRVDVLEALEHFLVG